MEQNHFMQNIEETYHSLTKVEKKGGRLCSSESTAGTVYVDYRSGRCLSGRRDQCVPVLQNHEPSGISGV